MELVSEKMKQRKRRRQKMRKYAKTALCIALSMAMMFTSTGMMVFAKEDTQAGETQQELKTEEDSAEQTVVEEELTEEQVSEKTDSEAKETKSILTDDISEDNDVEEGDTNNRVTEITSAEDITTEDIVSEIGLTEADTGTEETDVLENESKQSFSDMDIANGEYKEDGNDITWVINADGKLTVEGTGDFVSLQNSRYDRAPWYANRDAIVTAEIKVSGMTNASYMFYWCSNLKSLDLSSFDTSSVTSMESMFDGCSSLTSLDLSSFDTSSVTNMYNMFSECNSLSSLDLSSFNTSSATSMESMFVFCSSLTSLDLSGFDTSSVTNMVSTFCGCSNLTSLDLSSFDTGSVTSMFEMFAGCSNLTSLDLSSFDTSSVTSAGSMFAGCSSLTSLDLSSFDASGATDGMDSMFKDCDVLSSIYTPYNVDEYESVSLPTGDWYDMAGNIYRKLPKELPYSVLLTKDTKPTASTEHIEAVKGKTSYFVGDTVNSNDLTVRYYGSDGTVKVLGAEDYTVSKVDTSTAGVKTLTVTYKNLTAEIKLSISKKEEGGDTEESSAEESSSTQESSSAEESSSTQESSAEESSSTQESSSTEESSSTQESSAEESSSTEESSSEDKDDSPYEDSERTDLKSIGSIADIKAKVYDGNAYEPVVKVTVTEGKKKITLTEGADYRVLYQNNVNAGTGTVIVRGNGIYKGEITKTFTISQKPIKKLKVVTGSITGAGNLQTLPVYVYDGTKLLQSGRDYTLSDYKTVKANSAQVTVKAAESGNYSGSVNAKLTIYAEGTKVINPENVRLAGESMPYTGKAVKPDITVTVDGTPLTKKDYKVQYQNNKNAGTAFVIVTGKGAYKGKAVVPFTIKAETIASPNDFAIKQIKAKTYNGKLQKPSVSVTIQKNGRAKKLSKKDYTVTYKDNLHAGEAVIIVTGKGNYAGLSATARFTINPQQIKKASLKGVQGSLVLTYSKRTLKEGTDYEKPEYGTVNKNKVPVTIKGKGDFTGTMTKNVKVQ